jgi:ABC-2 type transport system ATP-binding protein
MAQSRVLEIEHLSKEFRVGFWRKRVQAVHDVSLEVDAGEIFGFLGPNGAGKTTTIKAAMGLIRPSGGKVRLFGRDHNDLSVRARVGFLPEQPYFYDYLKPREILDFYGRLYGIPAAQRRRRIDDLLERVGLADATNKTLRKFSKGMLQRVGLAQALIGEPELVVLDEPMSGLDPVGRKQVRDLMVSLKAEGKTVFFSSHILADIESICDRVAMVHRGRVVRTGRLHDLLQSEKSHIEIIFAPPSIDVRALTDGYVVSLSATGGYHRAIVDGRPEPLLARLISHGCRIDSVVPRRESLEELFVRETSGAREEN